MPQTLSNKIVVPINSDAYNLTTDQATMGNSTNVVIPVASQTERDTLTKKAGLTVTRLDIAGQPIEVCDGTNWSRMGAKIIPSTDALVGTAQPATTFTTGAFVPIIQGGTAVVTTDNSGYFSINYSAPFANGVLGVLFTNGDTYASPTNTIIGLAGSPFTQTLVTAFGRVADGANNPLTGATIRVNYVAFGW